jgi:1,4-alpha-glucan branching enzyme
MRPTARFGDAGRVRPLSSTARTSAGIGVILDWVPAHFPTDAHGLAHSTAPRSTSMPIPARASTPTGTPRSTISGARGGVFLVNNALYWAEKFHVDGLRVDAVASMLYLDYSRKEGEWIPTGTAAARTGGGRFLRR